MKSELDIDKLDDKKLTIVKVNHKLRPLIDNEDNSRTFASTTPSDNDENYETAHSTGSCGSNQSTRDIPIHSNFPENSTQNTPRIEVIQAPFYENGSLGRFFEIEILDIALSLKQKQLSEYFMKNSEQSKKSLGGMELMISNSDTKGHFFVKCTFDTKQNPKCYQYNSQYDTFNYTNLKLTNVPEQFITTPIQGDTSCGYFSKFFIVNAVEYVDLKLKDLKSEDSKHEDLKPEDLVKHFKSSQFNLKIVQDVLNYFNPEQIIFHINSELDESKQDNYFIFSGEGEQNQKQYYYCIKEKSNSEHLKAFGCNVNLHSIINYENILKYCRSQTFGLVFKKEQESSLELTIQQIEAAKRPDSAKKRSNRLASKASRPLQIAKDASKTANSRAKSVINYPSAAYNLARSPQQNQQQKPKPIGDKEKTTSYARISPMNARQIYKSQTRLNQINHIYPLQPLEPIVKPIRIPEVIRNQAKAQTASLKRDQQIQRSSSTFNPHHQ